MIQYLRLLFFFFFIGSLVFAGDVDEVKKQIISSSKYLSKNKRSINDYSKEGGLEFWSSGGLMHEIDPDGRPEVYDYANVKPKHIEVIILVPGKAAVAMYYSEGAMKPKGSPAVSHYMTRVTQAFIKEGGKWKVRASHWSPIQGGAGTSHTSVD